jgi:polyferredoxin
MTGHGGNQVSSVLPLRVLNHTPAASRSRTHRRRIVALAAVHVLIIAHVVHFSLRGSTLSPLEPSEASYTLRDGIINAGAIFFGLTILATLVFGRFFCGWACHVVAYQDMARWLLMKVGIEPRAPRLRSAFLLPLFTAFWLYGLPVVQRLWADPQPATSWHLTTDSFWRTFPGPLEAGIVFAVCGFLIVYFLGAKGFCAYCCPYGAIFGVADRVAAGRVRVTEACGGLAECTAHCSSNVDVAREVALYGKVVDPNCLKCLDCVSGCPNEALYYGFRPQVKRATARKSKDHPLTWREELIFLVAFALCYWIMYRLYRIVPVLLAVGMSAILAYGLLTLVRLAYAPRVGLQNVDLRMEGSLTPSGKTFVALMGVVCLLLAHSGLVQAHTRRGVAAFETAQAAHERHDVSVAAPATAIARHHLAICDRWGLLRTRGLGRMLGQINHWEGHPDVAVAYYRRDLAAGGAHPIAGVLLANALMDLGRTEEARAQYRTALDENTPAAQYAQIARVLSRRQAHVGALEILRQGLVHHPASGEIALELCKLLIMCPDASLREPREAVRVAEDVCRKNDNSHADLLAMLAWLYSQEGRHADALTAARRSLHVAQEGGLTTIAREMTEAVKLYEQRAGGNGP